MSALVGAAALLLAFAAAAQEPAAPEPPAVDPPAVDPPEEVPVDHTAPGGPPLIEAPEVESSAPPDKPRKPYAWHGLAIPYVYYTSVDKFGLGVGAELYERKRGDAFGYRYRLSVSSLFTTSGNYSSNYLQLERRGQRPWLLRVTYRLWKNMVYVGKGGADAAVMNGDEAFGNAVQGPSLMGNLNIPVHHTPLFLFFQGYGRYVTVDPLPGGPLDQQRPWGVAGGGYVDVSAGVFLHEVDRWPMPHRGVHAEVSVRGGLSASEATVEPIVGLNAEVLAWHPIVGRHLVVGARALIDKTWGERPFWEGENLGGTLRDEVAYEQMLTGYGRTRSRGDGVAAMMLELRPRLGETGHKVVDISFYLSAFAEAAWLFDKNDPGPFLPSVGVAPLLLWQGAVELRPWASWGWLSDTPDSVRTPRMQFGISLLSPL